MGIQHEGGGTVSLIGFHAGMMSLGGGVGPVDPYYANVSLLLHCNGTDGSTSFTDNSPSPKTPSVVGSSRISTAQSKFGGASFENPNNSSRLQYATDPAFGFGSGDFTIEMFANMANISSRVNNVFDTRSPGSTGIGFFLGGGDYAQPANVIGCSSNTGVLGVGGNLSGLVFPHVALSRESGTLRAFVNGVMVFSVGDGRTYSSSAPLYLGADGFGTTGQVAIGFMDEIRITKGVARYTSNFTPPAAPFPDS